MPSKANTPRTCLRCGASFLAWARFVREGYGNYCSIVCSSQSRRIAQPRNCLYCAKPFFAQPHELRKGFGKYCSTTCSNRAHVPVRIIDPALSRVCLTCTAEFQILPGSNSLYCSFECRPALPDLDPSPARISIFRRDGAVRTHALVDQADADWAFRYRWQLSHGYVIRTIMRNGAIRSFRMHRELMGLRHGDGIEVDHINHDTSDNRRGNLRIVSRSYQMQNLSSHSGSSSKYRGVCWDASEDKWMARVTVGGKTTHVGWFVSEEDAAEAVRVARSRLMSHATE